MHTCLKSRISLLGQDQARADKYTEPVLRVRRYGKGYTDPTERTRKIRDEELPIRPDIDAFKKFSNDAYQISPYFAIVQPEGTQVTYEKDSKGRIGRIEMHDAGKKLVRGADIQYYEDNKNDGVRYIFMTNYAPTGAPSNYAHILLDYDEESERTVELYGQFTSTGGAMSQVSKKDDGSYRADFILADENSTAELGPIQPWNGKEVWVVPASQIKKA
ncbi:hypothetical protein THASP1DRAFT_33065 [Thamnocephalis sphaerospora]|uniref:Uncharacterized protein n=1 Tax=Thamnocephalis sphaerospora TaxID=78915 RepID=A0A4P9XHF9_9FUNG|nr:hypothetical protein THASP1DRAFT_33065 [Thamnocephalis sphaerospora]|eukprot:RKP05102.1 hypothetical protein THASP1DRAFT_33065 [Thamnocephalis sphaerospora]